MIMKGLILSGGHGTRLRPLTYSLAKQLIPVANKPILFYAIEDLKDAGITDIGIIVGHSEEKIKSIKDAVGDGSRWGVKITYMKQDAPRGLAHAVMVAKDFLQDEPFVMYLGDNILMGGIKDYVADFRNNKYDGAILVKPVKNPSVFGVVEVKDDKIVSVTEKPQNPKSNLAGLGIYMFTKPVFDAVKRLTPSWRNELEITDAIQTMINDGCNFKHYVVDKGWFKDTGRPEDILEANHLVLEKIEPYNHGRIEDETLTSIVGRVAVGENTIIHKDTRIVGPVIIGNNCEIGPNSYIGPFTSIGDNCKIRNTEVEYSVILEGTIIETKKRIRNSLIGKNVRILSNGSLTDACQLILGDSSFVSL
jgi:glucose-1-phosphate thymidylyltransferase